MTNVYLYTELLMDMLGQVLCGVDGAVLTACATEGKHQRREASLYVAAHMGIGQFIDGIEECQNLSVVFQEADDWLVKSRQLLVGFITSRVVCAAAIKNISSAIATCILRDALLIGETENANHQGALCVIT